MPSTDLAVDDEGRSYVIMDWIKLQCENLLMSRKSCSESNAISQYAIHLIDQCIDSQHIASMTIRDPKSLYTKVVPKKIQRKKPIIVEFEESQVRL